MDRLDLKVTDRVVHLKRGSFYTIIGKAVFSAMYEDNDMLTLTFSDGGVAMLAKNVNWGERTNLAIPNIMFQRSSASAEVYVHQQKAFVYRSDSDQRMIFARPVHEFTNDRFEKITT